MNGGSGRMACLWVAVVAATSCAQPLQPVIDGDPAQRGSIPGVPVVHAEAFPEQDSRAACEKAIEAEATYWPSRLDVHRFAGYVTEIDRRGNRMVIQEFTARNSVGSEVPYRALCTIQPSGHLEMNMAEATAR